MLYPSPSAGASAEAAQWLDRGNYHRNIIFLSFFFLKRLIQFFFFSMRADPRVFRGMKWALSVRVRQKANFDGVFDVTLNAREYGHLLASSGISWHLPVSPGISLIFRQMNLIRLNVKKRRRSGTKWKKDASLVYSSGIKAKCGLFVYTRFSLGDEAS